MSGTKGVENMKQRFIEDPNMTDEEVRDLAGATLAEDEDVTEWLVGLKRHQREGARRADVFSRHGGEPTDEAIRKRAMDDLKQNHMFATSAFTIEPILEEDACILFRIHVRTECMGNGALEGEALSLQGIGTFTTTSQYFAVMREGEDLMKSELMGCSPHAFKPEGDARAIPVNIIDHRFLYAYEANGRPLTFGDLFKAFTYKRALLSLLAELEKEEAEADAITIRVAEEYSQWMRAATKRAKTKGITLKNRNGKEVTRIAAIEDFLELKPSGRKTMVKINQEATKLSQNGEYRHDGETVCRVVLGVTETAKQYGITEASTRKRLRRDFKAIANESITIKQGKNWASIPVAGGAWGIRGDSAFFTVSPDFMNVMLGPRRPQLDLPPEIYGTDDTNYPAALQIGFKLYNHDNMNFGRPNQDRMSLEALLHAATELPRPGTVDRHETEKIMGPFEATMDHLVSKGVLKDWFYCHEGGEPLTDAELEAIQTEHELGKPTPWAMAEGLLVTWDLGKRYPEREAARRESREKRKAAALEAKAEREKEAKAKEKRIRGKVETMEAKKRFKESETPHAQK